MTLQFIKDHINSSFQDPAAGFQLREVTAELRYDPLTGDSVRIFPFRKLSLPRHDWTPFVEQSVRGFCPFCPQVVEQVTPRFPEGFIPEGRLKQGDALLVPNLHPYEKYTGVIIMSSRHYVPIEDLNSDFMRDSFLLAREFIVRAQRYDLGGSRYASINWNYMPYAGGSLIHPHWQVMVGARPTNFVSRMLNSASNYLTKHGSNYWHDLVEREKDGPRFVGKTGRVVWLATYAPRHLADVTAVISDCRTINDLSEQDITDLLSGLGKVIQYYNKINIVSFNVALYFATDQDRGFTAHLRAVGRFTLFPVAGSDFSHLQVLHDEPWTLCLPEELAADCRAFWRDGD
ncbi:MAG: hypothetical protein ACOY81_06540 [Bacillota bacterium]|uniref:hypothetical protein n=1 Tax=Desulfurispora thermophila TaxID=265470 RepID=UPI0003745072|nr:hypothetical protein [Desulfurispora thermophila]